MTPFRFLALIIVLIVSGLLIKHLSADVKPSPPPQFVVDQMEFFKKNGKAIFAVAALIFITLAIAKIVGWDFNPPETTELETRVVVEGLEPKAFNLETHTIENMTTMEKETGFCKAHESNSENREKACNELSESNCNSVDCCVFLNSNGTNKCVAGGADGPTFLTDDSGKGLDIEKYYYKNKCYGQNC